jgi:hypothetical protein
VIETLRSVPIEEIEAEHYEFNERRALASARSCSRR